MPRSACRASFMSCGPPASVRKTGGSALDVVAVEQTPCTISLDPKRQVDLLS
jgi:hypothetical protein